MKHRTYQKPTIPFAQFNPRPPGITDAHSAPLRIDYLSARSLPDKVHGIAVRGALLCPSQIQRACAR
jgi:hypothetical protein